jgi:hypothetical protein
MSIPTTDGEELFIGRLRQVIRHPEKRAAQIIPGHGVVYGMTLLTPGWNYFIGEFKDGWGIYPENTSINYAKLVDHLIALLLEAHFHEEIQ